MASLKVARGQRGSARRLAPAASTSPTPGCRREPRAGAHRFGWLPGPRRARRRGLERCRETSLTSARHQEGRSASLRAGGPASRATGSKSRRESPPELVAGPVTGGDLELAAPLVRSDSLLGNEGGAVEGLDFGLAGSAWARADRLSLGGFQRSRPSQRRGGSGADFFAAPQPRSFARYSSTRK